MLDNARRGRCREVRVGMEIDEKRRVGCNERVLPRRSLVRVRECCIYSCARAERERGEEGEEEREKERFGGGIESEKSDASGVRDARILPASLDMH